MAKARLGMLFFLAAEAMMFAGLISAFVVLKAAMDEWPPSGQPRFPVAVSLMNMLILFASAAAARAGGVIANSPNTRTGMLCWHKIAVALGSIFLAIQGFEWWRLMHFGMTTADNIYTGSFYAVIGTHAIHALAGLAAMGWAVLEAARNNINAATRLAVARMYWYAVAGVWPVLYATVYR